MLAKLVIREKEICHITLEDVMCKELSHASDDYIAILKNVTDQNMQLGTKGSYMHECKTESLDNVLRDLKHFGFKVAVIWAEGSWPEDPDIDNEILKSVKEWDKEEWGCAGHILDRRQEPKFHHQCVIINLRKLIKSIECPIPLYEASKEHFHDDYTPKWIKPLATSDHKYVPNSGWNNMEEGQKPSNLFNCFLRSSLEKGLKVFNLDYNIRGHKVCIYPEDDIEWTENELFKKYIHADSIYDVKDNYPDKKPLLEFKIQDSAVLYVLNTERVPHVKENNIQVMVCPCSGLHQFKYMEPSLNVMEKVIWADYSPYAVKWMEILVYEWDGKDFHKFFENNKSRLNFDGTYHYGFGTWEKFLDSFKDENEWLSAWSKIRNLEHQFEVVDLINDYDKIVEMIPHNKNVLLQCSNIFLYESNYFNKGLQTTFNGIDYVKKVQSISNIVYLNGDLNGNYYDMTNINRQKWI